MCFYTFISLLFLINDNFTFCAIIDILFKLRLMACMPHPLARRYLEASFSFKMLVFSEQHNIRLLGTV